MDALRVALRFRDTTLHVDTIDEHRKMIVREGAVWWGWWKKEFEPPHVEFFSSLRGTSGHILLVDRSTSRCFRARYLRALRAGEEQVDATRVPAYYRDDADKVSGWFLLSDIQDAEFPEDIGRRLGETTLLVLDGSELPVEYAKARGGMVLSNRTAILHLSDLHFGADYGFLAPGTRLAIGDVRRTLTECILEDLKRLGLHTNIAMVLVTGDFTTQGDWSDPTRQTILEEFSSLKSALGIESQHIIATPGNHDVIRYPPGSAVNVGKSSVEQQTTYKHEHEFRLFQEELTGRTWKSSLNYCQMVSLQDVDIGLCALNSCSIAATEWTEYGYVGVFGVDALREMASMPLRRPTYKIMALHHHLIPVNRIEMPASKGVSLTLDAVELLDAAQKAGIHIALHGHQHLPRVATYYHVPLLGEHGGGNMTIVAGGSASATHSRLPGAERNSYGILRCEPGSVKLWVRELRNDAKEGACLFEGPLSVTPAAP